MSEVAEMFATKGERPEWEMVYDIITGKEPGTLITYQQLSDALGRDFLAARGPIYKARKVLEVKDQRTLHAIPKAGYRVLHAAEHAKEARKRQLKAKRQMMHGKRVAEYVRADELTAAQRRELNKLVDHINWQYEAIRRQDRRVAELEQKQEVQEVSVDKVAALEARMDRMTALLEQHLPAQATG